MSSSYVEEISRRQVTTDVVNVSPYKPRINESGDAFHESESQVWHSGFELKNYRSVSDKSVLQKSTWFASYNGDSQMVVKTQEEYRNSGSSCWSQTLRIGARHILVETLGFKPWKSEDYMPSYVQFKNSIYYFKRIWAAQEG